MEREKYYSEKVRQDGTQDTVSIGDVDALAERTYAFGHLRRWEKLENEIREPKGADMIDELTGAVITGALFLCCCVLSVVICMAISDKEQDR